MLSDENDSLIDSNELNTIIESVRYDGKEKTVNLYYRQKAKFAKGEYEVEIVDGKTLLGIYSFILN